MLEVLLDVKLEILRFIIPLPIANLKSVKSYIESNKLSDSNLIIFYIFILIGKAVIVALR